LREKKKKLVHKQERGSLLYLTVLGRNGVLYMHMVCVCLGSDKERLEIGTNFTKSRHILLIALDEQKFKVKSMFSRIYIDVYI